MCQAATQGGEWSRAAELATMQHVVDTANTAHTPHQPSRLLGPRIMQEFVEIVAAARHLVTSPCTAALLHRPGNDKVTTKNMKILFSPFPARGAAPCPRPAARRACELSTKINVHDAACCSAAGVLQLWWHLVRVVAPLQLGCSRLQDHRSHARRAAAGDTAAAYLHDT